MARYLEVARGRRKGAARCSSHIWYQSEKILAANGNDGVKPTTTVPVESMGGGGRRHEVELAAA
jgi:hypothetical protein